jgi:hypothetical protein
MEVIVKLLGQIQIGRKIVFRPMLANNAEVRQSPGFVLLAQGSLLAPC